MFGWQFIIYNNDSVTHIVTSFDVTMNTQCVISLVTIKPKFFAFLKTRVFLIPVPTVTLTSTSYMTQKGQPVQVCVTKDLATASDITGVITAYPIVAPNAATREDTHHKSPCAHM